MWDRVEAHSDEAVRLAKIEIEPATRPVLVREMLLVVQAAYLQTDLTALGVYGGNPSLHPLRVALPAVPDAHYGTRRRPRCSLSDLVCGVEQCRGGQAPNSDGDSIYAGHA